MEINPLQLAVLVAAITTVGVVLGALITGAFQHRAIKATLQQQREIFDERCADDDRTRFHGERLAAYSRFVALESAAEDAVADGEWDEASRLLLLLRGVQATIHLLASSDETREAANSTLSALLAWADAKRSGLEDEIEDRWGTLCRRHVEFEVSAAFELGYEDLDEADKNGDPAEQQ